MPKLILNLTPHGHAFQNSVIHFCQVTGTPASPERYRDIFFQCLSQIFHKMDPDPQAFMLNLMELPVWATIYYGEGEIDYPNVAFFADAMRAFGVCVWHELHSKITIDSNHLYFLESCSPTVAILGDYIDSALV